MYMTTDVLVIGLAMHLVVVAVVAPGLRALSGVRRSWVVKPPYNASQIASRNTWPFTMAGLGGALVMSLPATVFEFFGREDLRQLWWNLPFIWLAMLVIAVSCFWWPTRLAPRWYRRWAARGGTRDVMPWTEEEIAAIRARPEGRRRRGLLRDVQRCRELTAAQITERAGGPVP